MPVIETQSNSHQSVNMLLQVHFMLLWVCQLFPVHSHTSTGTRLDSILVFSNKKPEENSHVQTIQGRGS